MNEYAVYLKHEQVYNSFELNLHSKFQKKIAVVNDRLYPFIFPRNYDMSLLFCTNNIPAIPI